jgi:hypothetical protein
MGDHWGNPRSGDCHRRSQANLFRMFGSQGHTRIHIRSEHLSVNEPRIGETHLFSQHRVFPAIKNVGLEANAKIHNSPSLLAPGSYFFVLSFELGLKNWP